MTDHSNIHQRLALLLETACEQFELARAFVSGEFDVVARKQNHHAVFFARARAVVTMALAKEFIFNTNRAHRLVEHGKGQLQINRDIRKSFMDSVKPIIAVRDVNEHGGDEKRKDGKPVIRPRLHEHGDGLFALDETAMNVHNGTIFIGPLNLHEMYKAVVALKEIAGFHSLKPSKS
jgi:hypothetical protein